MYKKELNRVAIYIIMEKSPQGDLAIPKENYEYYDMLEGDNMIEDHYELYPLNFLYLRKLITSTYMRFVEEIQDEIPNRLIYDHNIPQKSKISITTKLKNKLKGTKSTHKTQKQSLDTFDPAEVLSQSFGIITIFTDISEDLIKVIEDKCEGNPLSTLQFVRNLIIGGFTRVKKGILNMGRKLKDPIYTDNWYTVEVPEMYERINTVKVDTLTSKTNSIKFGVVLKSASIVGTLFTAQNIKYIWPLQTESYEELIMKIKTLEQSTILEIIDEGGGDITCRFLDPFMRETLYQHMLYREHKKGFHALAATYMQTNSIKPDEDPERETQKLVNHMLLAEDLKEVGQLGSKAKRMVTVKRVTGMVLKGVNVIKTGILRKQGEKLNKKISKRFVVLTNVDFKWYHSEEEYKQHDELGKIYLKFIYNVIPVDSRRKYQGRTLYEFSIGAGQWLKKDAPRGTRGFSFLADSSEIMEEWLTTLELLRAHAIHSSFQDKFHSVSFPLGHSDTRNTHTHTYIYIYIYCRTTYIQRYNGRSHGWSDPKGGRGNGRRERGKERFNDS